MPNEITPEMIVAGVMRLREEFEGGLPNSVIAVVVRDILEHAFHARRVADAPLLRDEILVEALERLSGGGTIFSDCRVTTGINIRES